MLAMNELRLFEKHRRCWYDTCENYVIKKHMSRFDEETVTGVSLARDEIVNKFLSSSACFTMHKSVKNIEKPRVK
jgi:hypothetical protein